MTKAEQLEIMAEKIRQICLEALEELELEEAQEGED